MIPIKPSLIKKDNYYKVKTLVNNNGQSTVSSWMKMKISCLSGPENHLFLQESLRVSELYDETRKAQPIK
jgi:hypothetical protein